LSVADLLDSLAHRGFRFEIRGERIHVEPLPDAATCDELRAGKLALLSYIAEHGGRWPIPLASKHAYVVLGSRDFSDGYYGVCIACGIPWARHGQPAFAAWRLVDDPDSVELVTAQPAPPLHRAEAIVVAELAEDIGLSRGGRLCSRCRKVGRVDREGICTFCVDDEGK
jgi:hypothetical protein